MRGMANQPTAQKESGDSVDWKTHLHANLESSFVYPFEEKFARKREHEDNNRILLTTHILSTPQHNPERTRTPKALPDVMHLYLWLFRAKRESLSSRNNDILKTNIDILKLGERKAGSSMDLQPQPGSFFIVCKEGSPPHTSAAQNPCFSQPLGLK